MLDGFKVDFTHYIKGLTKNESLFSVINILEAFYMNSAQLRRIKATFLGN